MNAVIDMCTKWPSLTQEGDPQSAGGSRGGGTGANMELSFKEWVVAEETDGVWRLSTASDLKYFYHLLSRSDMCQPVLISLNFFAPKYVVETYLLFVESHFILSPIVTYMFLFEYSWHTTLHEFQVQLTDLTSLFIMLCPSQMYDSIIGCILMTIGKMQLSRERVRLRCPLTVVCCLASVFLCAALYLIARFHSVDQLIPWWHWINEGATARPCVYLCYRHRFCELLHIWCKYMSRSSNFN